MAENLELGNIIFNTNKNQQYDCPRWVVALLDSLDSELDRVMWNIHQEEYHSPFENTANSFKNDVFEVQSYSWDDEVHQSYNFKCDDIEISWYKYLGRDTTINGQYEPQKIIDMFNKCLQSILDMDVKY